MRSVSPPVLVCVLLVPIVAGLACGSGGGPSESASPAATTPARTAVPTAAPVGSRAAELATAVVQILALDAEGSPVWSGSGTVISADGLVLTNGHVVDDRSGEYDALGVALLKRTDEPPEMMYLAEIVAVDYALDLAVIQIASDLDGNPTTVDLPFVAAGDSDRVEIGDHIRILGYPGIGGETITFTDGVISGFTAERSVGDRAWIKTDATIAGGNSGGLAVNDAGELVGVPTIAGSGSGDEPVDCRYVADTNRDGDIDEQDTCVPVGGFINGLRPVNLGQPLVDAALSGRTYVSPIETEPEPASGFDTGNVSFSDLAFADGVTADDRPTKVWDALPSAVTDVCGFWDYEGMIDGMSWEALWFIDSEVNEEGSIVDDTWVGGESGNWWVCIIDDSGLADGLYELVLSVEGEAMGSSAVFVGGDHPSVAFDVENDSSVPICYVFLSPLGAQNWGFDKLGTDEGVDTGDTTTFKVPAGTYDLLIEDCDQKTLIEEYELDISEDSVYTVSDA